jgi:hypothetical protein
MAAVYGPPPPARATTTGKALHTDAAVFHAYGIDVADAPVVESLERFAKSVPMLASPARRYSSG